MRARFFCRTGALAGIDYQIDDQATIGRSPENSLQLDAAVVSQSHARIFLDRSAGTFVLEDLDSKNGTRLDGVPVHEPRRLGAVHVVTLGEQHDFIFVAAPPPVRAAATRRQPTSDTVHELQPVLHMPELSAAAAGGSGDHTVYQPVPSLEVPSFDGLRDDDAGRGVIERTSGETLLDVPASLEVPPLGLPGQGAVEERAAPGALALDVTDANGATRRVTLGEGRHDIGRSADCAISVDDRTLSRRHAVVTVTGDTVRLEDQDSRNGTFKDGERLTGPVSLRMGDVVTFGDQVTATVVAS